MAYIREGKFPQLANEQWLREHYLNEKKSCPEIALEIGCTPGAVEYKLHKFNIPVRGRHYNRWNVKKCATCGSDFMPSGPAAKFCSKECQYGTTICEQCEKEFIKRPVTGKKKTVKDNRFCSYECRWEFVRSQPDYGHFLNEDGYVTMPDPDLWKIPTRTPTMHKDVTVKGYERINTGTKRVLAHRYLMEQHLGRKLRKDETVHHKDLNKKNNDITNLQLRQGKHGKGAVAVCLDCGSHNLGYDDL